MLSCGNAGAFHRGTAPTFSSVDLQAVQRLLTVVRAPQIAGAVASIGRVGVRSLTPSTLSYFLLWL